MNLHPNGALWWYTLHDFALCGIVMAVVLAACIRIVRSPRVRHSLIRVGQLAFFGTWFLLWWDPSFRESRPESSRPLNWNWNLPVAYTLPAAFSDAAQTVPPVDTTAPLEEIVPRPVWFPGWIWLAGMVGLASRSVWIRLRFRKRMGVRMKPAAESLVRELLCVSEGRTHIRLVAVEGLESPIAWGLRIPYIAVPADFETRFSAEQRAAILRHEVAHHLHRDPWWHVLLDVVTALWWWHPAIWWMRNAWQSTSELSADDHGRQGGDGVPLAEALVACQRSIPDPMHGHGVWSVAGNGNSVDLRRRVMRLLEESVCRDSRVRKATAFLAVFFGIGAMVLAKPVRSSKWFTPTFAAATIQQPAADLARDPSPGGVDAMGSSSNILYTRSFPLHPDQFGELSGPLPLATNEHLWRVLREWTGEDFTGKNFAGTTVGKMPGSTPKSDPFQGPPPIVSDPPVAAFLKGGPKPMLLVRASLAVLDRIERHLTPGAADIPSNAQVTMQVSIISAPVGLIGNLDLKQSALTSSVPMARWMKLPARSGWSNPAPEVDHMEHAAVQNVHWRLSSEETRKFSKSLTSVPGVNVMASPRISTLSGRQGEVSVMDAKTVVTGIVTNPATGFTYTTRDLHLGPTIGLLAWVTPGGVDLRVAGSFFEFLGYDDSRKATVRMTNSAGEVLNGVPPHPRLRTRHVESDEQLEDGESLLIRGPDAVVTVRTVDRIPALSDIPWIGRLFTSSRTSTLTNSVWFLVQPEVMDPGIPPK